MSDHAYDALKDAVATRDEPFSDLDPAELVTSPNRLILQHLQAVTGASYSAPLTAAAPDDEPSSSPSSGAAASLPPVNANSAPGTARCS